MLVSEQEISAPSPRLPARLSFTAGSESEVITIYTVCAFG